MRMPRSLMRHGRRRASTKTSCERLARAAHDGGVQGVLLAAHHNIAWLTGGRINRVDASREAGTRGCS